MGCNWFNRPWLEFTGVPLEKQLGNGWANGVHPDDFDRCLQIYVEAFNRRQPFAMEYRLQRYDGVYRWILDRGAPRYECGEFLGYIGGCIDVTDQHLALEQQARLAAIINASGDAIISTDLDGRIVSWNQAAQRLFGYSPNEVVGRSITLIFPDKHGSESHEILAVIRKGKFIIDRNVTRLRKDGTKIDVSLTVSPIYDEQGQLIGASKIERDIGARRRLERELNKANAALRHERQQLQDLSSIIAHDLKHPVVGIAGLLTVINKECREKLDDTSRRNLQLCVDECERMRQMLTQLGALGRIDRLKPNPVRINLREFLHQTVEPFRNRINNQQVCVEVDCAEMHASLPREMIAEAMANLLDNALKYGAARPGSRLKINCGRDNGDVSITVADDGPGIDPKLHDRIFEPFRRATRDARIDGSGIGLAAVKSLMRRLGGHVSVQSTPGAGAAFTLKIPVHEH